MLDGDDLIPAVSLTCQSSVTLMGLMEEIHQKNTLMKSTNVVSDKPQKRFPLVLLCGKCFRNIRVRRLWKVLFFGGVKSCLSSCRRLLEDVFQSGGEQSPVLV